MSLHKYALRPYQLEAISKGVDFFRRTVGVEGCGNERFLIAGPTGVGKSLVILGIRDRCQFLNGFNIWTICPRLEIIAGMLDKLGVDYKRTEDGVADAAWDYQITTPIRLRNRWLSGAMQKMPLPDGLIIDESHHDEANIYQMLHLMFGVPAIGLTATPYRGTPKSTKSFKESWGDPWWMITYKDAAAQGYISLPVCRTVPLLDDDVVKVVNGEFDHRALSNETMHRLEDAARLISSDHGLSGWRRPTIVNVSSVEVAESLTAMLEDRGCPARCITGDTPTRLRFVAFKECESRESVLVHVNVVSEGVDLNRLRVMYDLSPTMSPVKWCQLLGRITRAVGVGEAPPEYICCNRNLIRHLYILNGVLPDTRRVMAEAEEAFKGSKYSSGRTSFIRVFGTEGLGRLKPTSVPLLSGVSAIFYCFSRVEGSEVVQYAVIFHPLLTEPVWAERRDEIQSDNKRVYTRWRRCDPVTDDIVGFTSAPTSPVTKPQLDWWKRSAEKHGLALVTPDRKQFNILPVLSHLNLRML